MKQKNPKTYNFLELVRCAECRHWTEKEKGWGRCEELPRRGVIQVLGGVWWPQGDFGCIYGEKK